MGQVRRFFVDTDYHHRARRDFVSFTFQCQDILEPAKKQWLDGVWSAGSVVQDLRLLQTWRPGGDLEYEAGCQFALAERECDAVRYWGTNSVLGCAVEQSPDRRFFLGGVA